MLNEITWLRGQNTLRTKTAAAPGCKIFNIISLLHINLLEPAQKDMKSRNESGKT